MQAVVTPPTQDHPDCPAARSNWDAPLPSPPTAPPAAANPLLHAAKICNQLSLGPLKIGGFLIFAAIFFLSRVLLVPWAVLKPALLDSRWA